MTDLIATLSRRQWLQAGTAVVGGLALTPFAGVDARAAGKPGTGPARLNYNENPFGPSPKALAAIRDALPDIQRYVGADEVDALIAQIAAIERVDPSQVLIGEVLEALGAHLALSAAPGGEFIYSEPGYTALVDAVGPYGGKVVPVPLDAKWENDLPALAAKIGPSTRALFVVNPHNPTATLSDDTAFKSFVGNAAKRTLVIVDEAYLDYNDDAAQRSAVGFVRERANVVVFRTLSKIHGLAGASIGYALGPPALVAELRKRGVGGAHSLNRLSLAAAKASLADGDWIADVRRRTLAERALWSAFLDQHRLRHTRSRANFVFFDSGRPHAEIAPKLLAAGVKIGKAYSGYGNWLRISIGLPAENVLARKALADALR